MATIPATGAAVRFTTEARFVKTEHTGTVTGVVKTLKGPFVVVKRADGREFKIRPAKVTAA